jgi:hypothetical protein
MKLVGLIKMYLNETYISNVRIGKHLSHVFPIYSFVKQGDMTLLILKFFF